MCSHGYFYQGNEKQTCPILKGHYVCHISFKEPYRLYTSRISYRVPKLIFSQGRGEGRLFEGGRLLKILSLMRGAYLKLGANSSIIILWIVFGADCLVL